VSGATLALLRCPVCRGPLVGDTADEVGCPRCGERYPCRDGILRLLDDRLAGIDAKRAEIGGWVALAREQEWYRADDDVDRALPFVNRELGWDDEHWRANERAFERLLATIRPGDRVLEVGAAKCWASRHVLERGAEYVATDILDDGLIGLGRGGFYGEFPRLQADGEHLPLADAAFDVTFCVATLHHALDLGAMVRELARVTRRGGVVAALNEGARGLGASGLNPEQEHERDLGINEHVHTVPRYLAVFVRAGVRPWHVELTGDEEGWSRRRVIRDVYPRSRRLALALAALRIPYGGVTILGRRLTS
jgi:SAM-dependent methyltransferase